MVINVVLCQACFLCLLSVKCSVQIDGRTARFLPLSPPFDSDTDTKTQPHYHAVSNIAVVHFGLVVSKLALKPRIS